MEIKHIYWFAYFNLNVPSVRYRAKFPLQQFRDKHGITFSIVYPGYDLQNMSNFILTFFSALFFRKSNSIIVFQKIHTSGIYATALKVLLFFRPQHTLYDIDDAAKLEIMLSPAVVSEITRLEAQFTRYYLEQTIQLYQEETYATYN